MFALCLAQPQGADNTHAEHVRQTIARALDVRDQFGNRAGNQAIIDAIGLIVRYQRDEAYCEEALDYHLGLLYAYLGDADAAANHFERSGTHPGTGGNQLFPDHQSESLALRRHQERAKERSIPSVLIASMPRSASASLSRTIAATLDVPIMRASCGRFPNFILVPRWFDSASSGGAVLHDHFGASPCNLKVLRGGGVDKLFVRIRDPRAAVCSSVNLDRQVYGDEAVPGWEALIIDRYQADFVTWLQGWIAVANDPEADLHIEWLRYGARDEEIADTAQRVLTGLAARHPALEPYAAADVAWVKANLVVGNDEHWRGQISPEGQARLWEATPEPIRDLLELRP